tara:strand:- start:3571 stop:3774 length:204 start_codon:yes stop_codon:yes gene_type:complete
MKSNKIVRPMRKFGDLLKDLFYPKDTRHFWVRVKDNANTKEEKDNFIFATIELLNERIQINGQNTKH